MAIPPNTLENTQSHQGLFQHQGLQYHQNQIAPQENEISQLCGLVLL